MIQSIVYLDLQLRVNIHLLPVLTFAYTEGWHSLASRVDIHLHGRLAITCLASGRSLRAASCHVFNAKSQSMYKSDGQ